MHGPGPGEKTSTRAATRPTLGRVLPTVCVRISPDPGTGNCLMQDCTQRSGIGIQQPSNYPQLPRKITKVFQTRDKPDLFLPNIDRTREGGAASCREWCRPDAMNYWRKGNGQKTAVWLVYDAVLTLTG